MIVLLEECQRAGVSGRDAVNLALYGVIRRVGVTIQVDNECVAAPIPLAHLSCIAEARFVHEGLVYEWIRGTKGIGIDYLRARWKQGAYRAEDETTRPRRLRHKVGEEGPPEGLTAEDA